MTTRITDRQLWQATALGLVVIAAWFATTRTTLLLAYGKTGQTMTLSQAQGLCDSSLGQLARNMSAQGAANCSSVDSYAMWLNVAGFAGLMIAVVCAGTLVYRAQHKVPA